MRVSAQTVITVMAAALCLGVAISSRGQSPSSQDPQPGVSGGPDPIQQLRLTPEQRERIRAVMEQSKDDRATINRTLREANRALDQTLDADNLDETLLEQRIRDVSVAQTAQLRMRIQTEVKIRSILNPEQLATLRFLRMQARDVLRRQQNDQGPNRPGPQSLRPNRRNGIAPLSPRRDVRPRDPRR